MSVSGRISSKNEAERVLQARKDAEPLVERMPAGDLFIMTRSALEPMSMEIMACVSEGKGAPNDKG